MMSQSSSVLSEVSLVTANFNDGVVFADVLQDWFQFLGGKPGEVVVVDCGSNAETQAVKWQLFQNGLIDKLQVIQPNHPDNADRKNSGYLKDFAAWLIASKPYVLLFRIDTLPYREGHENWLEEAIAYLDREDVFAVSGSFNLPAKHHDAWPGWYFTHKCSHNFALMKRSMLLAAIYEYADDFIRSGFTGTNPADPTGDPRGVFEFALEEYMQRHNIYTLCKKEDPTWTVFHTNVHEKQLQQAREKYLARQGIDRYINVGDSIEVPVPANALYYGQPPVSLLKQLRIAVGQSSVGPLWRSLKQKLT